MFVGRERELAELEDAYGGHAAFAIYGRRGIGKTALAECFCEGKRTIFLNCLKSGIAANLEHFADIVSAVTGREAGPYRGYRDLFEDLAAAAADSPAVIVIDEYPYLAADCPPICSHLQFFIDILLPKTRSVLIVTGSAVGFMKRELLDGKAPLFGRFWRMPLGPLSLEECKAFHPSLGEADRLRLYLTFGGVPRYMAVAKGDTYDECVRSVFTPERISEEVESLVRAETPRPYRALAIISAISHGAVGLKEISKRTRTDDSSCLRDLTVLEEAGIVGTVRPMLDAPRKSRMYTVKDSLCAFDAEVMQRLHPEEGLTAFLDGRFEKFCVDLIRENYIIDGIGKRWTDRDGVHEEMGIVAESTMGGHSYTFLAECLFRDEPMGFPEYHELVRKSGRFDEEGLRLMLISVSGFDAKMADFARDGGVMLVGPDEIFGRAPMPKLEWDGSPVRVRTGVAGSKGRHD